MTAQVNVRFRNPKRTAMRVLMLLAIVLASGLGTFFGGKYYSGIENEALSLERNSLQQRNYELEQEKKTLSEKYAVLERSIHIDKGAYKDVEKSLRVLEQEMLELKEEVVFYRGIVSPKETAAGLYITSFKINPISDNAGYHMKLVLSQVKKNTRTIYGDARIYIDGILNGEPRQLQLSDIAGKKHHSLKMKFKYFQNLELDIVLPAGFVPSSVLVDLKPTGKSKGLKKTYSWAEVTT